MVLSMRNLISILVFIHVISLHWALCRFIGTSCQTPRQFAGRAVKQYTCCCVAVVVVKLCRGVSVTCGNLHF